jgi:hypothetical protein
MPRYGQGGKVPLPTQPEIDEAYAKGRGIVACSAVRSGPVTHMKFAFHNGDTSTVYLPAHAAHHLLRALKAIVPDTPHITASLWIKTADGKGQYFQEGEMSG